MLVNFEFAPNVMNLLNKAVASHWPDSIPCHERIIPKDGREKTLFYWDLAGQSSANAEDLFVTITDPRIVMKENALLDIDYDKICIVHETGKGIQRHRPTRHDIGIASLQLPHEFAKRLAELKARLEISQAEAA